MLKGEIKKLLQKIEKEKSVHVLVCTYMIKKIDYLSFGPWIKYQGYGIVSMKLLTRS